jgi:hypothetical protein
MGLEGVLIVSSGEKALRLEVFSSNQFGKKEVIGILQLPGSNIVLRFTCGSAGWEILPRRVVMQSVWGSDYDNYWT